MSFGKSRARLVADIVFIDELDAIGRERGVRIGAVNDDSPAPTVFVTELSDLQRRILKLLGVPSTEYRG